MEQETPKKIGIYEIKASLGKGGMGEVFLAFDPICERHVAIKQIRKDLAQNKAIQDRFLREAKIASQLTHPSIIPIYAINYEQEGAYYTMPYVEGETLRQVLRIAREQEKNGEVIHPIGSSIPALIRIFLNVCQAIAYTHSKRILHRDLKPENVIIGKYGEVLILDWGIAEYMDSPSENSDISLAISAEITHPGKIPGTLAYMPPERALGEEASPLTDIYALGVILYQILTLRLPFQRTTLPNFKKHMKYEKLIDPQEKAPYRDIPLQLSNIVKKCLHPEKENRYQRVEELILDLDNYIEGRPEWIFTSSLHVEKKEDWEFQENILLAKHIAITRNTEVMEWVGLMVSQDSFLGNSKLETTVQIGSSGNGIGFLLGVPEGSIKKGLDDAYCLWIGSYLHPGAKLIRSNVALLSLPHIFLSENQPHRIRIEKIDNHLHFYLDDNKKCSYVSHVPLTGTHVGVLAKDADFHMDEIKVYSSAQNVMVNSLAIPDAFLANKDFPKALMEFRRIGNSFPGRAEGREGLFRAGTTLLEEALMQKNKREKQHLFLLALDEFGKLHATPGAPLEYLGKSLVYKAIEEVEEEIKCLELALRKFPKHPLLSIINEHILFRLHEASLHNRLAAYHFALLALRHLPEVFANEDNQSLLDNLQKHWEKIPFLLPFSSTDIQHLALQLAFWLAKPITLIELLENNTEETLLSNTLFSLLELGCFQWTRENLHFFKSEKSLAQIEIALLCHEKNLIKALDSFFATCPQKPTLIEIRTLIHLFDFGINTNKTKLILPYFEKIFAHDLAHEHKESLDALYIWTLLLENKWKLAHEVLDQYPLELLNQESHPFHFLFGCYLWAREGKEIAKAHFSGVSETPYPPSASLLGHYILGSINLERGWIEKAFYWEKLQLYRQLALFYHCKGDRKKEALFQKKVKSQLTSVTGQYR